MKSGLTCITPALIVAFDYCQDKVTEVDVCYMGGGKCEGSVGRFFSPTMSLGAKVLTGLNLENERSGLFFRDLYHCNEPEWTR